MSTLTRGLSLPCRQGVLRVQPTVVVRSLGIRSIVPNLFRTADPKRFFISSLRQSLAAPFRPRLQSNPKSPTIANTTAGLKPKTPTAANAISKTPKNQSPTTPTQQSVERSQYAFVKHLAVKSTPTLLYEAPSHFCFYSGCWLTGVALIAWTGLTGPTVIDQPEGIPSWVGVVYGITYAVLGAMGFYLISKTHNVVKSIRILPAVAAAVAQATPGSALPSLRVECVIKRMVPFVRPKVINTTTSKLTIEDRLSLPDEFLPENRRLEQERQEAARLQQLHKYDMEHLMTMPFRRIGRALGAVFSGTRSAWTDSGFRYIIIDDKRYKIDVDAGFSHDGSRTLERIVSVG